MRGVEAVIHRLNTVEFPGKGSSLEKAIEFYIANFKGDDMSKIIAEYAKDYLARKALKLEKKSMEELKSYVNAFVKEFGHQKPADIGIEALETYMASKPSRYYRDKCLRPFFAWLTGTAKSKVARLLSAPLKVNTFDFIEKLAYSKQNPTEILHVDELLRVLEEAKKRGVVAWFVWCVFTGTRPEAEARPFWKLSEHGWKRIDLSRGIICITEDLEKTGCRNRDITIQPNMREWMLWMQTSGTIPRYSRRRIREVFDAAVPSRNVQDILRHTFISFLLKRMQEHEVCYQAATSSDMIKKHYRRQVTDAEADTFWAITPKTLGL